MAFGETSYYDILDDSSMFADDKAEEVLSTLSKMMEGDPVLARRVLLHLKQQVQHCIGYEHQCLGSESVEGDDSYMQSLRKELSGLNKELRVLKRHRQKSRALRSGDPEMIGEEFQEFGDATRFQQLFPGKDLGRG